MKAYLGRSSIPDTVATLGRRGFALIAVLACLVLIATAVTSLAILFATENQRTVAVTSGAQLRELLLASAPFAAEEFALRGGSSREVAVATPLPNATLTLVFRQISEGRAEVRAVAKIGNASLHQVLIYGHGADGQWHLESATLGASR